MSTVIGQRSSCQSEYMFVSFLRKPTGAARVQAVITSKGKPTADVRDRARTASDLHMMIQHDGKERDAHQWADILTKVCAFRA